jgi:ElaB/YqjD/DUF883 family membrane-anchored ribosome-binding protein
MTSTRKFVWLVSCLQLVLLVGCEKKKASLPPKTLAPTVAVVLPDELPLAEEPQESSVPETKPAPPPPAAKTKPKKPARSSTSSAKKSTPPPAAPATPAPQPQASNTQTVASLRPPKSATPEAVPPSALATAIPSEKVLQQKEDTARMVDATENALKGINRSLTDEQKSMRSQIRSYLQQSRKATTEGDFERAYNLAKKAQLLADALVKP